MKTTTSETALDVLQPYCPECGRAILRTMEGPIQDIADAWIVVRCPCGWKGKAQWARSQHPNP